MFTAHFISSVFMVILFQVLRQLGEAILFFFFSIQCLCGFDCIQFCSCKSLVLVELSFPETSSCLLQLSESFLAFPSLQGWHKLLSYLHLLEEVIRYSFLLINSCSGKIVWCFQSHQQNSLCFGTLAVHEVFKWLPIKLPSSLLFPPSPSISHPEIFCRIWLLRWGV